MKERSRKNWESRRGIERTLVQEERKLLRMSWQGGGERPLEDYINIYYVKENERRKERNACIYIKAPKKQTSQICCSIESEENKHFCVL